MSRIDDGMKRERLEVWGGRRLWNEGSQSCIGAGRRAV